MSNQTDLSPVLRLPWMVAEKDPQGAMYPAPMDPALARRAEAVSRSSARQNLGVYCLGIRPLFNDPIVCHGVKLDAVVMPVGEDPLYRDPDGFPIPQPILDRLRAIDQAGLDFDTLYVLHELPAGTVSDGKPLRAEVLLPPAPRRVERLSKQFGALAQALWTIPTAGLLGSILVGGVAAAALVAGALMLDPVLMGVIVAPGRPVRAGEPAAWFYLAHWRYGEEEA